MKKLLATLVALTFASGVFATETAAPGEKPAAEATKQVKKAHKMHKKVKHEKAAGTASTAPAATK